MKGSVSSPPMRTYLSELVAMVVEGDFTARSDVNHCIYNAK